MPEIAAIIPPTIRPRRSMSSRASVSSATTMAKNITVTAMYQEVAIQLATSGRSIKGMAPIETPTLSRNNSSNSGMKTSRSRRPVAMKITDAASVISSYGLGSMKTIAPDAPTSHTSARCIASTPGAAVTVVGKPPAVAAYAITHPQTYANRTQQLIGVLVPGHQRHWRLEKDVEIEQHRPVLDVVEVELDALLDFLLAVALPAPAVDLGPAGDAGLDPVTREIAVDGLVEQPALQLALHRVRTRADQRQVALEHDVEELRQLIEAGLADEAPDPGDAAVVLGHDLGGQRIGLIVVQRAELEDVDALVVEAEALLAEQHRARTVEFDGERDQRHHRRGEQQHDGADDVVEQPLHHQVPVGDRRLEHLQRRHLAEIGIGAGAEAQLVGVGGKPDVDRQHPQFLQHFQNPRLRRNRQREQHEVDTGAAGKFDDIVDLAEFCAARAGFQRATVVAVV